MNNAGMFVEIKTKGAEAARSAVGSLRGELNQAARATDALMRSAVAMGVASAAAFGALSAKKLVDVTREFDVLNAQLITATGGTEQAAKVFEHLERFAAETPYDLAQVTDSFVKLVNYGLTPSKEALTSYGDTASALGKDLNQMIEAVADAATGEFERLKEFGIKSSSEGDRVKFTFRGITTEVGKNAEEIEGYLISLGQNNFAGAMAERMNTLDGALSNLGDAWDALFRQISDQGVGDLIEEGVRKATAGIEELTDMLASGQIEGYLAAIGGKFDGFGNDVETTLQIISRMFEEESGGWGEDVSGAVEWMSRAFAQFPENVRAAVQIATVEIASFVDKARAQAAEAFNWKEIALRAGGPMGNAIAALTDTTGLEAKLQNINQARNESIDAILAERATALASFDTQIESAERLRQKYDELKASKTTTGDPLAGFKIGGSEGGTAAGATGGGKAAKAPRETTPKISAEEREAERLQEQRARDYADLLESLMSEEEAIQASYERRMQIVLDNTAPESEARADLSAKLKEERDAELADMKAYRLAEVESIRDSLMTEEEEILASYERRREIVLANTEITEAERADLMEKLAADYTARQMAMEQERQSMVLSASASMFGEMAGLAKTFAGEQSDAYKALFAVSKAFAIADATIKVTQAIATAAASTTWPANLAAMASVAASTAGLVGTIAGTNFSGAYDQGGIIPAGSIGLVGEYGPELVKGPATVTSREETARLARSGGKAITMNNTFVLNSDAQVDQFRQSERQLESSFSRALRRADY
ncbi:tape measure protein [Desulfuromonas acetexigens]|uniref:Tape measure protein N-terminal domain-containing protein n=1 Tax=Trichloromonas acetexigens TaxID=38815 RepID=A0A550J2S1_9BACT|nr:tape measure protein [Desulfuromonas acetexigens]TRO77529.1 hypothetical protein FL622_17100 [Desulfuromonas acetexigens]